MITFGTSRWRAGIADEFTFEAARRVTQAISARITERAPGSDVGKIINGRIGVRLTPEGGAGMGEQACRGCEEFGGRRVVSVNRVDWGEVHFGRRVLDPDASIRDLR